MRDFAPRLTRPGLLVTATDTEVGKTVITCAIAAAVRRQQRGARVGVCKPFASGCRREREGLVAEDAEALAHFADCRQPLDVINPIRFAAPLAPAVAAEQTGQAVDWPSITRSLETIDRGSDLMLVEGVGGLFAPLDPKRPTTTVLDVACALDYPVVVVARSGLGTLNHTAMTVALLKDAGVRLAGIVMNGYDADVAASDDPSVATNRPWMKKLTGVDVVATVPRLEPSRVQPQRGVIDDEIIDAVAMAFWPNLAKPPRGRGA